MMKSFCILALVLLSAPAFAQPTTPAPITGLHLYVMPATEGPTGTPILGPVLTPISAGSPLCNRPMPPAVAGPLVNPSAVAVTDPFTTGRACLVAFPPGMPVGQNRKAVFAYVAASCTDAAGQIVSPCEGDRVVASPFFHTAPVVTKPAAPTAAVVVP